ncbi:hypothetical protein J6590_014192 [Homalodisca vitripennis]|nr:hypothetical protein J6590_014192 [Homalodisca vitripennis]
MESRERRSSSTSQQLLDRTRNRRTIRRFTKSVLQGQNGFEELRRYIKQGGDFCKDLSTVLHER